MWTLTEKGIDKASELDNQVSYAAETFAAIDKTLPDGPDSDDTPIDGEEWRDALLSRIMSLSSGAFEPLCQLFFKESGFNAG